MWKNIVPDGNKPRLPGESIGETSEASPQITAEALDNVKDTAVKSNVPGR
jgi:hypothetical protein